MNAGLAQLINAPVPFDQQQEQEEPKLALPTGNAFDRFKKNISKTGLLIFFDL